MTELLTAIGAPWILGGTILVFGFLPGFTLRIFVLLYPSDSARRKELIAELYFMRRLERPIWVAEQIETALFEGTAQRVRGLRRARLEKRRSQSAKRQAMDILCMTNEISIGIELKGVDHIRVNFKKEDISAPIWLNGRKKSLLPPSEFGNPDGQLG